MLPMMLLTLSVSYHLARLRLQLCSLVLDQQQKMVIKFTGFKLGVFFLLIYLNLNIYQPNDYMASKKLYNKTNTLIIPLQHPNASNGCSQLLHTPSKRNSAENQSFLSPLPFPPKRQYASEGQLYTYFDQLRIVETPLMKSGSKMMPYHQELGISIGIIGGRIIFETSGQQGNNNSSELGSQASESEQINHSNKTSQQEDEEDGSGDNLREYGLEYFNSGEGEGKMQRASKSKGKVSFQKQGNPNKKIFCNCKKTKCLKLYCDCFRLNQTCEGCNCVGCHNLQIYTQQRSNAILTLMDRNPDPFGQKIEADKHVKGCNCKKSGCQKKYCQCFQAGLKCNDNCKCQVCKNTVTSTENSEEQKGITKNTAKKQRKMVEI